MGNKVKDMPPSVCNQLLLKLLQHICKMGLQNQPIKFVNLQETMNYIHGQLLSDFLYIHLVWTTFVYLDVFKTKLCWFFLGLNKTTTHLVKKITGIVNFQLCENVQEEIADTFA